MSSANLKSFLTKLQKEMQSSSSTYRRLVSDKKPHTFYLTEQTLIEQTIIQAESDGVTGRRRALTKLAKNYFAKLQKELSKELAGVIFLERKISGKVIDVTVVAEDAYKKTSTHETNFKLVRSLFVFSRENFYEGLEKVYKEKHKTLNRSTFLDIGHTEESAVVKKRISDALLTFGEIPKNLKNIEEIESIFSLTKNDDTETISVSLESATVNRLKGSREEREVKSKLLKDLGSALTKLDSMNLKGSDSFTDIYRKKAIKTVLKAFEGQKNIRIKSENTKTKKSSKVPVILSTKGTTTKKSKGKSVVRGTTKTKTGAASLPLQLIGIFNQQLPRVLEKNMRTPALENRTGRFANSVKVTDVTRTTKGFPSFGYTYERNPYEVFEVGRGKAPWATPERDPRILIDKSMREIASQFALGRFFTRRV